MRFLHTGDLHLGSALGSFSPREASLWRERQFEALERLIGEAITRGAEFLLFAGDCFDTDMPDMALVRRFFALLGEKALPVVIAPGNHDPYRKNGFYDAVAMPSNVCLFREEQTAFFALPSPRVNIYGYAFCAETHATPALPTRAELPADCPNILLAHADLLSPLSPHAPITAGQLEVSGFSYVALGHIHKPTSPRRFGNTTAAYCGFFAGRGFDETGAGHANFVEIDGPRVQITPIKTTADCFFVERLDCTGAHDAAAIRRLVAAYFETASLPQRCALRLVLFGEVGADCTPDLISLSRMGEGLSLFEIKDETLPLFDAATLAEDPGLRGGFYRAMLPRLQSADSAERAVAAEALRLGFAALAGRELS